MDPWFYSKELQPRQSVFDLSFVLVPQVNADFKPGACICMSTPYGFHACLARFNSSNKVEYCFVLPLFTFIVITFSFILPFYYHATLEQPSFRYTPTRLSKSLGLS